MTPATRILFSCSRTQLSPAQREGLARFVSEDVDWDELAALGERHGVAPLLFRHLEPIAASVPREVVAALWARHEAKSRRNEAMSRELVAIMEIFNANGIRAAPYKGPALACGVYGDVALRDFGDLDILMRSKDVLVAKALLLSRGYVPLLALDATMERALVHSHRHYEMPFIHRDRRLMVELHWRTDPDLALVDLDDDAQWEGLGEVAVPGGRVRTLGPEDLLLVLCLHGTKHFWFSLGWLVDVAELIARNPGLDWARIAARARRSGCARKLALSLHLAREWLQADSPAELRNLEAYPGVGDMATRIGAGFELREAPGVGIREAFRLNLALQDNLPRRLRYAGRTLFTPGLGDWAGWRLPRALRFLYWPLRIARLAKKYLLHRAPA